LRYQLPGRVDGTTDMPTCCLNVSGFQNYWALGLCPSSGILKTRKHNVSRIDLFPSSGEMGETYSAIKKLREVSLNCIYSDGISKQQIFLSFNRNNLKFISGSCKAPKQCIEYLKCSQSHYGRVLFCGKYTCLVWYKSTDVSEVHTASTFRVDV
jgi:hypothetical protein